MDLTAPPHVLLLHCGELVRDITNTPEARNNARRVFDELLALATSHGFTRSRLLRALCADGHYASPQASTLAHAALDHVPADRIRAALDRAGFMPDTTTGTAALRVKP